MNRYLLLITLMASCGTDRLSADEIAVRSLLDTVISADNRADISAVLSCYSEDAVLMLPGQPSISGMNAIEQNYRNVFSNTVFHFESHIDEVNVFPSYAVVTGTNVGSIVAIKDSSVNAINDKYMILLEKENTKWKIKKLIYNKNQ